MSKITTLQADGVPLTYTPRYALAWDNAARLSIGRYLMHDVLELARRMRKRGHRVRVIRTK